MESGAIVNTKDNNGDEPFHVVPNRGKRTKKSFVARFYLFEKVLCLFHSVK